MAQTPRVTPSQGGPPSTRARRTPVVEQGGQLPVEADLPAGAVRQPVTAGGEQSPVALHSALALLHRRLLQSNNDELGVELSPQLKRNHGYVASCFLCAPRLHCMTPSPVSTCSALVEMLEDTLAGSQNNSVLLLGPRGSGKSLVLRRALRDVTARHGSGVVPVHLSGLVHSDERVALREMARQLDERRGGGTAALLSRVTEFDALALMAGHLKHLERTRRSAIFVLDDFDAFAPATRRQTLLYNLMDALQASAVRAVVVGVSVCVNAAEMLEKRVRSRFSHRRLVFQPEPGDVGPALRRLLTLPPGFGHPAFAADWNGGLVAALGAPAVTAAIAAASKFGGLPRLSAAIAMHALSRLAVRPGTQRPGEAQLLEAVAAVQVDPFQELLQRLPKAHLLLLAAAKRLQSMRQQPVFTFGAVFAELTGMSASPKYPADCIMPRDVALSAFEALVAAGAFEHADSAAAAAAGGAWLKEYAAYALVVADSELREAIQAHKQLPSDVVDYLTREGVTGTGGAPLL